MAVSRALLLALPAMLAAASARADDHPVEHPAVERPALPQAIPGDAAPVERPSTARPAPASGSPTTRGQRRRDFAPRAGTGTFVYLAPGLGVLAGLSGGRDFERANPALTGLAGVEVPLSSRWGLGIELTGDLELAGDRERGSYTALLVRGRLGTLVSPRARLWGALGLGLAGYESATVAGSAALGSTFFLTPKFGLDLSANLARLSTSHDSRGALEYPGGTVVLFALRALFELRR